MPGLTSLVILSSVDFIPANATKIMSKQLQTLDLSGIKDINEAFFLQIIEQSGKTLKSLNLSNSKISGDKLVEYNGALSCLEKLELELCRRLTNTGLKQILKLCGKTLISLNLRYCQIADEGLLQIFKVCGKTLRNLNLAITHVTEESLVGYSGTLACLENLDLSSCPISDEGLLQIFKVCGKTLRNLNLAYTNVTGESLVGYSGTLACLENLDLRSCPISDMGLLQIFKVCGKTLRNLDLAYTKQITDRGFLQIFKVCGKTLRNLNLTHTNVTGESWFGFSGTLACLDNLNLSYCHITDRGLSQILPHCGKTLRYLNLACANITGESLVGYSGNLTSLDLRFCLITDRGLVKILQHCGKTLKYMNLHCTWPRITRENLLKYKRMGLLPDSVTVSLDW